MAALSIRNLDDRVKDKLRTMAAEHGHSMEAEVREILIHAVGMGDEGNGLLTTFQDRFRSIGGIDLDIPKRSAKARSANLTS
ncbi:MAG: plasmid stabilization protein [Acidimicrobiales bacterium]|nr:plasmid stabilization protein [Acidimicrobiales bacterium]